MKYPNSFATALAAAVTLLGCAGTPTVVPSEQTVAAHVARANALAGNDAKVLLRLCNPPAARQESAEATDRFIAGQIARVPPAPAAAFDNLVFIGGAWASAWALKTSEGIILIDALNNTVEAAALIEGGLRKLGLDPAQIRYVVITHGHGDHYGGAKYLADKYKARVVMSEADWTMLANRLEFASRYWDAPPQRDIAIEPGGSLTLGDTTIVLQATAGHTWGTMSPVFAVRTGGKTHRAILWGGTSFNFGKDLPRVDAYIESARRMGALAKAENIDVMLSNHPSFDGTVEKFAAMQAAPTNANPFVIGQDAVVRSLGVMEACARAQRDRFAMTP
jgi:metallo-beta-lactamase class B